MAITFNDNLNVSATKPVDRRYGTYNGTSISNAISVANAATVAGERYKGLTVGLTVNFGPVIEYWYKDGITNNDLVEKAGSVSGAGNGLTNTGGVIGLGGSLNTATTILTGATETLTIGGLQTATSPTHYLSANSSGTLTLSTVSSLTTTVQNAVISAISATNGLTKTGNNIKLGGTLIENTSIPLGDNFLTIFNNTNTTNRSESTLTRSSVSFDTYDTIVGTPNVPTNNGSRSRIISTKASNSMWTTNYLYNSTHNPAYRAWENWLADHPWIVTKYAGNYPAGVPFQIADNLQATNRESAVQAHYLDERVGKSTWADTWTNPSSPNSFGVTFPGWVVGNTYTLRILDGIDDFNGITATTISGTPYTSGWVFTYTSGAPNLWITSTVDGDFPIIDRDDRTSFITTSEGADPLNVDTYQKGLIQISATSTVVTGLIDQGTSTRGFRLAIIATLGDLPANAVTGEMVYLQSSNSIVVKTALGAPNNGWRKVDLVTI
jgi:hypothetical protein